MGNDSDTFFNHLTSMLYMYSDSIDLFIGGGDFNAIIGELDDFIVDIDVINNRQKIDLQRNKHGDAFIEFLLGGKLCVLNGRVQGENNFTCIKPQGKSVVDYLITCLDDINM